MNSPPLDSPSQLARFSFPSPVVLESLSHGETADLDLALRALCETQSACGECRGCKKVKKGFHPDWLRLTAPYKVEEIRDTLARLRQRPFEAKRRILTLSEFDSANLFVQNSLLKTFEEPLQDRVLIILMNSATKLVSPLRSRCFILRDREVFAQLSEREAEVFDLICRAENDSLIGVLMENFMKERSQFRATLFKLLKEAYRRNFPGHWQNLAPHLESSLALLDRNLAARAVWERAWAASLAEQERAATW